MNLFNFDESEVDPITGMPIQKPSIMPEAQPADPDGLDLSPSPAAAPAPMNPAVKDYIAKKFDLGKYTNENRQKLAEQSAPGWGDKGIAALAAIGAGFQGRDAGAAGLSRLNAAKAERDQKLSDFDKGRANTVQDYSLNRQIDTDSRADDVFKREQDPASRESAVANELAQRMGYKGAPITAAQFKGFSPALEKMYAIEQKKLDRQEARDERRYEHGVKSAERKEEKDAKLKTPFGPANTEDDAKKLKEAFESKQNFDNKIEEMIQLRKDHGGGALLDREAVARGKQLSKDLLLEYKNMAKLGVLSAADEKIINAIIPADPLEYNSPIAAIQGQDPILNNLQKFKGDSDKDFQTRISTRTRGGGSQMAAKPQEKTIVKTQTNKTTGQKRVVYSDGSSEIISGKVAGK